MSGSDGETRVHATLVAVMRPDGGKSGVLLFGSPGAGKSEVALRLIETGAVLVADDQVELTLGDGGLWGAPPEKIAGLIEARGIGLLRLPFEPRVRIALGVELLAGEPERMPARRWYQPPQNFRARGGALRIPLVALDGHAAATPAKIKAALLGRIES
jgi:HPr kinase/phosphorylase